MKTPLRARSDGMEIYIDGLPVEKFKKVALFPNIEQGTYYLEFYRKDKGSKKERYLVYDMAFINSNLCVWCTTKELA